MAISNVSSFSRTQVAKSATPPLTSLTFESLDALDAYLGKTATERYKAERIGASRQLRVIDQDRRLEAC